MSAASVSVALAVLAVGCANVFLFLTLTGAATAPEQTLGTRLWASFGVLTVLAGIDAYAIDNLGRYFGF